MFFNIHQNTMIPIYFSIFIFLSLSFIKIQSFNFPDKWNFKFVNDPKQPLSTASSDFGSAYRCYTWPEHTWPGPSRRNPDFNMSLCFFSTAPNSYTLGLGTAPYTGDATSDPGYWVWAANTNRPVRDGAVVFLLPDGNLILYDVDGRVAWQSNTTNKGDGWVAIRTRVDDMYGNMVLVNINDDIPYWQSFDHPQYTLFPNQVLNVSGAEIDKLVSYRSTLGGRYTMMMSSKSLDLYYKCAKCSKPLKYYTVFKTTKALNNVVFTLFDSTTPTLIQNFVDGTQGKFEFLNFGKTDEYVALTAFLRIEMDGNLKIYAYLKTDIEEFWDEIFKVFLDPYGIIRDNQESDCQLPEKCLNFGICDQSSCVSCPTPKGLTAWSDKCMPPKLVGCSGGANVTYYKVEGVEHFTSKYTRGLRPITQSVCESKCNVDCKCLGYFYHQETSECWVVPDLKTMTKSTNPQHFGYVKLTN